MELTSGDPLEWDLFDDHVRLIASIKAFKNNNILI